MVDSWDLRFIIRDNEKDLITGFDQELDRIKIALKSGFLNSSGSREL